MSIATQDKSFAEQKLMSAISLLESIDSGEWPYPDSREALAAIKGQYQEKLNGLLQLGNAGDDIVAAWCSDARALVARYHTFIGVILRSSNVRNAFEVFAPIERLASNLLGLDYKIVLGSEWSYTPFVFPIPMTALEQYIFIGLPASEAGNSLLVPLAGHELGHAVWRRPKVNDDIKEKIRSEVLTAFLNRTKNQEDLFDQQLSVEDLQKDFWIRSLWKKSYELALRQSEEVFCDILGCWLFGEGFLHAFRYMMCPEVGHRSAEYYPSNIARAEFLDNAMATMSLANTVANR